MSLVDRIGEAGAAALRRLDPEQAHRLAIKGLAFAPLPRPAADDPMAVGKSALCEMKAQEVHRTGDENVIRRRPPASHDRW